MGNRSYQRFTSGFRCVYIATERSTTVAITSHYTTLCQRLYGVNAGKLTATQHTNPKPRNITPADVSITKSSTQMFARTVRASQAISTAVRRSSTLKRIETMGTRAAMCWMTSSSSVFAKSKVAAVKTTTPVRFAHMSGDLTFSDYPVRECGVLFACCVV